MDSFYIEKGKKHLAQFVAEMAEREKVEHLSSSKIDQVKVLENSGDSARLRFCGYEIRLYQGKNPDDMMSASLDGLANDSSVIGKGHLTSRLGYVLSKKGEILTDESVESAKSTLASIISGYNFKLRQKDPLYPCNIVIHSSDISVGDRSDHFAELKHAGWRGYICSDVELTARMRDYLEKEGMYIHALGTGAEFSYVLGLPK
jgi:hypothetical protein